MLSFPLRIFFFRCLPSSSLPSPPLLSPHFNGNSTAFQRQLNGNSLQGIPRGFSPLRRCIAVADRPIVFSRRAVRSRRPFLCPAPCDRQSGSEPSCSANRVRPATPPQPPLNAMPLGDVFSPPSCLSPDSAPLSAPRFLAACLSPLIFLSFDVSVSRRLQRPLLFSPTHLARSRPASLIASRTACAPRTHLLSACRSCSAFPPAVTAVPPSRAHFPLASGRPRLRYQPPLRTFARAHLSSPISLSLSFFFHAALSPKQLSRLDARTTHLESGRAPPAEAESSNMSRCMRHPYIPATAPSPSLLLPSSPPSPLSLSLSS